ncbi:MAG: 2Fe-2S iron-sulfur cluster-binding protein, partial [Isosphaeraceae bacterium]
MAAVKTLSIDGRLINARGDQTILEAANEVGIAIPTLCHLEGVSDVGACRMCLVEVGDPPRLMPACTTKVF